MENYNKNNIVESYYDILVFDSFGDEYDTITRRQCPQDIIGACKRVIEMIKHDKELGADYGIWSYLVCKHEVDDDTDWVTYFKVYKYRHQWRYKRVEY